MKVATVFGTALLTVAQLDYELYTVEGLNLAKLPPDARGRIGTTPSHSATMQPIPLFSPRHNSIIFQNSPLDALRQENRRSSTRLCNKNSGTDEDTIDASDEIADKTDAGDDETTITKTSRRETMVADFLYGANYVNSQYLSILWRYSIVKTFTITVPIAIALWMNNGLYNTLCGISKSVLALSSIAARLLQLPLEFAQTVVLSGWNVSPETLATAITFLPNFLAIPLVQLLLGMRTGVMLVVDTCSGSNVIRFLSSLTAILIWRPAVEEWQYRSVLDKLLFGVPRWMLAKGRDISPSKAAMVRKIKTNLTSVLSRNSTSEKDEGVMETSSNSTMAGEDDLAPFLPDESTRILLGSILFATTRLGWLSADPADTVALSNSPYGFTIGFLQSLGSLFASSGGGAVSKDLRILILLLAIHQTISTFFVAQHVFAGIYKRRGLAASVGAHVSWTVGKATIPFRLGWNFWQSAYANLTNANYGNNYKERPPKNNGEDKDESKSTEDNEIDGLEP